MTSRDTPRPRQGNHAAIARSGNTIFSLEDDSELVVIRLNREKFDPVALLRTPTSHTCDRFWRA